MKKLIEKIIEDTLKEMISDEESPKTGSHPQIGKRVLIRTRLAGIHYGFLESVGDFIILSDSRRIWNWSGAFTLSAVSQVGPSSAKIAMIVPQLSVPVCDLAEIHTVSETAANKLDGIPDHVS